MLEWPGPRCPGVVLTVRQMLLSPCARALGDDLSASLGRCREASIVDLVTSTLMYF